MNMLTYVIRRILFSIPLILVMSFLCFVLIQLPPGDYISMYIARMAEYGQTPSDDLVNLLRERYGIGEPFFTQYWKWVSGFPRGDFGVALSFSAAPVSELLKERLPLTFILNFLALVFSLVIAIPIGVFSASHKYTVADYGLTFLAFVGISIPGFLLALFIIFLSVFVFNTDYIGFLFSQEFVDAPWSWARLVDFLKHLPVPLVAIGVAGTANVMRIMRGNMLDILGQQFIQTARAKGLKERAVLVRHAARIAINPIISRIGVYLPEYIATEFLVSIILNLPTVGPLFLKALTAQDMYLAGTILLVVAVLLIVGNLVADILLAWTDPRIRFD